MSRKIFAFLLLLLLGAFVFFNVSALRRSLPSTVTVVPLGAADAAAWPLPENHQCNHITVLRTAKPLTVCAWSSVDDHWVSATLNNGALWEPEKISDVIEALQHVSDTVQAKPTFADIGANLGLFSLVVAQQGTFGQVYAVEPLPENVGLMLTSMRANGFSADQIKVFAVGAAEKAGNQTLFVNKINRGGSSFDRDKLVQEGAYDALLEPVASLPIVTLDSIVREPIHVMKIDTEALESCVLRGAHQLLHERGVGVIFLELWLRKCPCFADSRALLVYLQELGYDFYHRFHEFMLRRPPLLIDTIMKRPNAMFVELACVRRDLLPPPVQ